MTGASSNSFLSDRYCLLGLDPLNTAIRLAVAVPSDGPGAWLPPADLPQDDLTSLVSLT